MLVSIVIPALDEEDGISLTLDRLPIDELRQSGYDVEVVVVDGNSRDRTREVAHRNGARVVLETRSGYGRACKTGFQAATGEVIVTADADGTYPEQRIPGLVDLVVKGGYDFVTTSRMGHVDDGAMSGTVRFGNRILSRTASLLFPIRVVDSQSGMWAFKRSFVDALGAKSNGMPFSEELKIRASLRGRVVEVPIVYRRRVGHGKLHVFRDGLSNLLYLFYLRMTL